MLKKREPFQKIDHETINQLPWLPQQSVHCCKLGPNGSFRSAGSCKPNNTTGVISQPDLDHSRCLVAMEKKKFLIPFRLAEFKGEPFLSKKKNKDTAGQRSVSQCRLEIQSIRAALGHALWGKAHHGPTRRRALGCAAGFALEGQSLGLRNPRGIDSQKDPILQMGFLPFILGKQVGVSLFV